MPNWCDTMRAPGRRVLGELEHPIDQILRRLHVGRQLQRGGGALGPHDQAWAHDPGEDGGEGRQYQPSIRHGARSGAVRGAVAR